MITRPKITKDIIKEAALLTAKSASNIDESEHVSLAKSITEVYEKGMNGYDIAKEMDDHCL